jgi:glutamine synthetase
VNVDTYKFSDADLAANSIHRLPASLGEAIEEFAASDFAKTVLGEDVHASYLALKRAEWLEYNTVVSDWERKKYLQLW